MSSEELGLPLQVLLLLLESCFIILNLASGNVDLRLKVAWVDPKKQIALPHLLVVSDRNLYDRARDPRCDTDYIRSDLAIPRPGIFNVSRIE
jgi:hypothetical protein